MSKIVSSLFSLFLCVLVLSISVQQLALAVVSDGCVNCLNVIRSSKCVRNFTAVVNGSSSLTSSGLDYNPYAKSLVTSLPNLCTADCGIEFSNIGNDLTKHCTAQSDKGVFTLATILPSSFDFVCSKSNKTNTWCILQLLPFFKNAGVAPDGLAFWNVANLSIGKTSAEEFCTDCIKKFHTILDQYAGAIDYNPVLFGVAGSSPNEVKKLRDTFVSAANSKCGPNYLASEQSSSSINGSHLHETNFLQGVLPILSCLLLLILAL